MCKFSELHETARDAGFTLSVFCSNAMKTSIHLFNTMHINTYLYSLKNDSSKLYRFPPSNNNSIVLCFRMFENTSWSMN